jgi:membrane protein DedA with SNARE-associated domain
MAVHGRAQCPGRIPAIIMSHTAQILTLLVSWILVSVGCHALIKRYFLATFVASFASVAVLLYAGYIELGHLDPLWHVSSITGFFMAGIVALVVGLPFRIRRTIRDDDA